MKAKVAYAYGWTDEEINRMDIVAFRQYFKAITAIEAEQLLLNIQATTYPHLKPGKSKKLFRDIKKLITDNILSEKPLRTTKDIAMNLARKLSG